MGFHKAVERTLPDAHDEEPTNTVKVSISTAHSSSARSTHTHVSTTKAMTACGRVSSTSRSKPFQINATHVDDDLSLVSTKPDRADMSRETSWSESTGKHLPGYSCHHTSTSLAPLSVVATRRRHVPHGAGEREGVCVVRHQVVIRDLYDQRLVNRVESPAGNPLVSSSPSAEEPKLQVHLPKSADLVIRQTKVSTDASPGRLRQRTYDRAEEGHVRLGLLGAVVLERLDARHTVDPVLPSAR